MRRRVLAIGGALTVGAIGLMASRLRRRGKPEVVANTFPNGMGYLRFGSGGQPLLWIPDPSHTGHVGPRRPWWCRAEERLPGVDDANAPFVR